MKAQLAIAEITFSPSVIFIGYNIGAAVGGFVAAKFIPAFGWQSTFYLGGIVPIVLGLILVFTLPESVRFLARGHCPGAPSQRQAQPRSPKTTGILGANV